MEIVLIIVIVAATTWVAWQKRDATQVMLYVLGSISISGIALSALHRVIGSVPLTLAQAVITLVFAGLFLFFRAASVSHPRLAFAAILPLATATLAVLFLVARLVSLNEVPELFAGVGRLAYAEDNAKWVNFSSLVAQGEALNFKDGTGAVLSVALIVAAAVSWLLSMVVLGGASVAGIAVGATLGLQLALIALMPLALSPVLTKFFSQRTGTDQGFRGSRSRTGALIGLGIATLVAVIASAAMGTFGHLTLQTVLLLLLFWLASSIYLRLSGLSFVILTTIAASAALTWLPLPPFAVAVVIAALVVAALRLRSSGSRQDLRALFTLVLLLVAIVWLTTPEVRYLSATTQPSTSTDLVFAEGGTMSVRNFEWVLLVFALLGSALVLWQRGERPVSALILHAYPVVLMLGFAAAVLAYDFVIARDGWPHYGSRKLTYLMVMLVISGLLPLAFVGVSRVRRWGSAPLFVSTSIVAVAVLLSQSLNQVSVYSFKRTAWTVFETRQSLDHDEDDFWVRQVTPPNSAETGLSALPIACAMVRDGEIVPGINDAYFCTRFLLSLHGTESYSNTMFYPLLVAPTQANIDAIKSLPSTVLDREVLVIDEQGFAVTRISVAELVDLYAKQPPRSYAAL